MYGKEYHNAMKDLHFSPDFNERTIQSMQTRKIPRRGRGPLYTAVAAVLVVAIALTAFLWPADGPNGPVSPLSAYALAEPAYPDFPQQPIYDGSSQSYFSELSKYETKVQAFRKTSVFTYEMRAYLKRFAGQSTRYALEGHEDENVIYSPLSLWNALAMLAQCAGGQSRQQVLDALETDGLDDLQTYADQVWRQLYTDDGISTLIQANSIWLNTTMSGSYNQATLNTLAKKYYAGAYSVPMGQSEADQAITDWISQQTKGLIGSEGAVVETRALTLALLISSLYYKTAWTDEFSSAQNSIDTFTCSNGQTTQTTFMHQTSASHSFQIGENYRASSLSAALGEVIFVLPDEGVSPEALLQDPAFFSQLTFPQYGNVEWSVPKFDISAKLDLEHTLTELGITDLLDESTADLSNLSSISAYLSSTVQLARIKVDEEGIEGAAVTILESGSTAAPDKPDLCVMDLDRPFLFIVEVSGIPIFVGVVNQL